MIASMDRGADCDGGGAAGEVALVDRVAGWVGVRLLMVAVDLVPAERACPPVDVHGWLCAAGMIVGLGDEGAGVHRLADTAEALLTDHLVRSGQAVADAPGGTLRGWLVGRSPSRVARELRRAAGFHRLCLLADELGCDGLSTVLLAEARGAESVSAAAGAAWSVGGSLC